MSSNTTGYDIYKHIRIQLEAIQIHLTPRKRNSENAEHPKSFAVLLEGGVLGKPKVTIRNYVWGDVDWHPEPPILLEPDTSISIKIKRRNFYIMREEVLATFAFSDVAALFLATVRPRDTAALDSLLSGEEKASIEFQQEHKLGNITVRFGFVDGTGVTQAKGRAMTPDKASRRSGRTSSTERSRSPASPSRESLAEDKYTYHTPMYHGFPAASGPPVDSGKTVYGVVGTPRDLDPSRPRPKPK